MKSIFITGSSGFVGKNVIKYFNFRYNFYRFSKNEEININQDVVLHFAGKAHDLKNTSNAQEYYIVNTELTNQIFDSFLSSDAEIFIFLSSVKAVADELDFELTEDYIPNPITHYGKSKLLAEQYILSKVIPVGKKVYILRPCMIHGPGNKGNLNSLYNMLNNGIPWPFGLYSNKRSFLSIENLCFIINEIINRSDIPSGIYNLSDNEALETTDIINLISKSIGRKIFILNINKSIIEFIARIGDIFNFPLNTERLKKLTENYIVSNYKINKALGLEMPIKASDGLKITFEYINREVKYKK